MKYGFNPYLPFWETVPDGEPHVFGDRVYVYGSHDKRNGTTYCEEDYVCWSAAVDALNDWKFEGVIYRKTQDPINGAPYDKPMPKYDDPIPTDDDKFLHNLYAPDVCQGKDGRYYLYYAMDFCNIISVAVADTPVGPFEFLDYITREDGSIPEIGRCFDPAILSEESGNYLYYGLAPQFRFPGLESMDIPGSLVVKLSDDMHTIISEPVVVANGCDTCKGTSYEAHPFLEASSIRKIGEWYYFVYSSLQGHELCYAMSKSPLGPFEYKGVIVSNGDIGLNGDMSAKNYFGNNHGGIEIIAGKAYIFWHRHSHGTAFSRQGCADAITINADGTIDQIEMTSCGLNNGPLPAAEHYSAHIACQLMGPKGTEVGHVVETGPDQLEAATVPAHIPYITEELCTAGEHGLKPFIYNMQATAVAGFKYFEFSGENKVLLEARGKGKIGVCIDDAETEAVAIVNINSESWKTVENVMAAVTGVHALFFKVIEGKVDIASFGFGK